MARAQYQPDHGPEARAVRPSRAAAWEALAASDRTFDIVVVGGGITGAGVAREAARRGLKTLLVEQRDFAWGTSSRSSKMIHGGLRYLGSGQFRLTRDAVRERQRMLEEAPGLVDPLPFVTPHYRGQFPGPRIFGALLWLYDKLAGRPDHQFYPGDTILHWVPGLNREGLLGGNRFIDAVTDDARLVLRVLDEARHFGATTLNYVKATGLTRTGERVTGVELEDVENGAQLGVKAPLVINATGAWTDKLRGKLGQEKVIRPLRGSHLVVPFWRLPVACSVLSFHPEDRRAVFVYPWEGVTVIGTTDLDHSGDLDQEASITPQEVDYLLAIVPHLFPGVTIRPGEIRASWAGVRPVVSPGSHSHKGKAKAPSKETREHALWDDNGLISVAGGKLTTFRLIALEVLEQGAPYLGGKARQAPASLDEPAQTEPLQRPHNLPTSQWRRLQGRYGLHLPQVLEAGSREPVADTRTLWAELVWAARSESVVHLDDLMLRRTRLGLLLPEGGRALLPQVRAHCQEGLGWDEPRWEAEVERYLQLWHRAYSLPGKPVQS